MAGDSGISWIPGDMMVNVKELSPRLNAVVAIAVDRQADVAVRDMKINAPWTDRTGNARNTLAAKAEHFPRSHKITLHGGMPYQIWLETRFAGRFAIILPQTLHQGRELMKALRGLMGKAGH